MFELLKRPPQGGASDAKDRPHAEPHAASPHDAFIAGFRRTAPVAHVNTSVPGVKPDVSGLAHWADDAHHVATEPAKAKSPQDRARDQMADFQAQTYANLLISSKGNTDDKKARWTFLNTLDRVDDPVIRQKMKEKFAQQTGQKLDDFIEHADWHGGRDKQQALDMISPERDATERKLAAMPAAERNKLEAEAHRDANKLLNITNADDANDKENAHRIADLTTGKTPEQIELLRAQVRNIKGGKTSIYAQLDRSLSGGNEDEAVAGLKGDPVYAAQMGLINAKQDPDRQRDILRRLKPAQIAQLKLRNAVTGTSWITDALPKGAAKSEIEQLVAGNKDAANGEHIANLFKDPEAGLKVDGLMIDDQGRKNLERRETKNVLKEMEGMSAEEITNARVLWNTAHPDQTWETMIDARFKDGDPSTYMRLKALASGDKLDAKARKFREAARTHNQQAIEEALTNPDLSSQDPEKKAAAQREQQALNDRIRTLDAIEKQTVATMQGQDPTKVAGRTTDQQIEDHYAEYVKKDPDVKEPADLFRLADRDKERDKRKTQAKEDHFATDELVKEGQLSTVTQVRRAETKGDKQEKANLLEAVQHNHGTREKAGLEEMKKDFRARYGKDMLQAPNAAELEVVARLKKQQGDDRPLEEIQREIAYEKRDFNEERLEQLRVYGAKPERRPDVQLRLQKQLREKTRSGDLAFQEHLRAQWGGNEGLEVLSDDHVQNMDNSLKPASDKLGIGPRELKEGVTEEEFRREDEALTETHIAQREAKMKLANETAQVFATIAKIGALVVAQPELMLLIDVAAGLGEMAIKKSIGGEAYDSSHDEKALGITAALDVVTLGVAKYAKGLGVAGRGADDAVKAGQEGAHIAEKTAADVVEQGATAEARAEIAKKGVQKAAGESAVVQKEITAASKAEGEIGHVAASTEKKAADIAEQHAVKEGEHAAVQQGTHAIEHQAEAVAAQKAARHVQMAGDIGTNVAGQVAYGALEGDSPTQILANIAKSGLAMFLPAKLGAKIEDAIGDATKAQRVFKEMAGSGAEFFGNIAISGAGDAHAALDAGLNTGGNRYHKHAHTSRPHADEHAARAHTHPVAPTIAPHGTGYSEPPRTPTHSEPSHPRPKPSGPEDWARWQQDLANSKEKLTPEQKREKAAIDDLKKHARSREHLGEIRKAEHEIDLPVSQRTHPHDEQAVLDEMKKDGNYGKHPDGTSVTREEHEAALREEQERIDHEKAARARKHAEEVEAIRAESEAKYSERDQQFQGKVRDRDRISVDSATVGVGLAGTNAATANAHTREVDEHGMPRYVGISTERGELWHRLPGLEEIGQTGASLDRGLPNIAGVAHHPTAQNARAGEAAAAVAHNRAASGLTTLEVAGPLGALEVPNAVRDENGKLVSLGGIETRARVQVGVDEHGLPIYETKTLEMRQGVDFHGGMGPARELNVDTESKRGQISAADAGALKGKTAARKAEEDLRAGLITRDEYQRKVEEIGRARVMLSGEDALSIPASSYEGQEVLVIGGGPTAKWAGDHAVEGGASNVTVAGKMPRPTDPRDPLTGRLNAKETQIRERLADPTHTADEMAKLRDEHHAIVEQHIVGEMAEVKELERALKSDAISAAEKAKMREQLKAKQDALDPFVGSRVDRNEASLNNPDISHLQIDVARIEKVPGPNGDRALVTYVDGTQRVYDRVIPGIGANADAQGGVNAMLTKLPGDVEFVPVIENGRPVGLMSDPPGITISGAAAVGTTGVPPQELFRRIPRRERDAYIAAVKEWQNRDWANGEGASHGSRNVAPGIENVGENPALMQIAKARTPEERRQLLSEWLEERKRSMREAE